MNFKKFIIIFFIVFGLFLHLGSSVMHIKEIKEKFYNDKIELKAEKLKECKFSEQICYKHIYDYDPIHETNEFFENDNIFATQDIQDWDVPYDLFLLFNTRDQQNFTNIHKTFSNSFVEIWQTKNCHHLNIFLYREMIIKLVETYKPCSKKSDFIFQTHIYCMLGNFMNKISDKTTKVKFFLSEFTKIANLYFLAEKYDLNIISRFIFDYDATIRSYILHLYVVRIQGSRKKGLQDYIHTRKYIEGEKMHWKNKNFLKMDNWFNPEEYKCDLDFFFYKNNEEDKIIKKIHDYQEEIKDSENILHNQKFFIIISENKISDFVNDTKNILADYNIENVNDYVKIFNDNNFDNSKIKIQSNKNMNKI